jgi:hypothetical protein
MPANRPTRTKVRKVDKSKDSVALPQELSDRLDHLARLPQNWDSYGAVPISPNAITRARSTLRQILSVGGEDIPLPFIAPSPNGGVELELTTASGRELMLDISPGEECVAFLLVEPTEPSDASIEPGRDEKETEGTIGDLYTLKEVVRRLLLR